MNYSVFYCHRRNVLVLFSNGTILYILNFEYILIDKVINILTRQLLKKRRRMPITFILMLLKKILLKLKLRK